MLPTKGLQIDFFHTSYYITALLLLTTFSRQKKQEPSLLDGPLDLFRLHLMAVSALSAVFGRARLFFLLLSGWHLGPPLLDSLCSPLMAPS